MLSVLCARWRSVLLLSLLVLSVTLVVSSESSPSDLTPLQIELSRLNQLRKDALAADAKLPKGRCGEIALSEPAVLNKNLSSYEIGSNVVVSCQTGFKLIRSSRVSTIPADSSKTKVARENIVLTCLEGNSGANPSWSTAPSTLTCIPESCPPLILSDKNLQVDQATGVHGDVRRFSCREPYTLDGAKQTICDGGAWSPSAKPTCYLSECDGFDIPTNGNAWIASNDTSPVRVLKYSCNIGYKMRGDSEATCLPSKRWSSKKPQCLQYGLKPYENRVPSFSAGSISIENSYVIKALVESARRTPNCIGFTISRVDGAVRAALLHSDESFLQRKAKHDTYLFGQNGKYEVHRGFAASTENAILGFVEFASDAHVLSGVQSAVNKLKGATPSLIGFSVARGKNFQVQLATWSSLPLSHDDEVITYTLSSVERQVREIGCFAGDENGRGILQKRQLIPNLDIGAKASRLSCANYAIAHGHKYFALSNGQCFSGNENPSTYGDITTPGSCGGKFAKRHTSKKPGAVEGAFHTFSVDSALLKAGIFASRCKVRFARKLNAGSAARLGNVTAVRHTESCMTLCSNTLGCTQAAYDKKDKSCTMYTGADYNSKTETKNRQFTSFDCSRAALINGGFEIENIGGEFSMPIGRNNLVFGASRGVPRAWSTKGSVGVAVRGSNYTNDEKTIPDGAHLLWMKAGSEISQQISALKVGKTYQLSFMESFRVPNDKSPLYQSGMTLAAYVDKHMVYSNLNVNLPLWEKRIVNFVATATQMTVRFIASDEHIRSRLAESGQDATQTIRAAILLDTFRVEKERLRSHRGRVSGTGRGIIQNITATHPRMLKAFANVASRSPNTVGFSIKDGEVRLVSKIHLSSKQVIADANSTLYLLNGTVLAGFRTALSAGNVNFNFEKEVGKALREIAEARSNSVGYALGASHQFEARILGAAALPMEDEPQVDLFLFPDSVRPMGCWNAMYQAGDATPPFVLENKQQLLGGVTRHGCALAAARDGHRYFALQNKVCVSGNTDDFRLHGASAQCNLRCLNGKDLCGGERSALVYRLPSFVRLSRGGVITMKPKVPQVTQDLARLVFDEPGTADFTTEKALIDDAYATQLAARRREDGSKLSFRHSLVYHFPGSQRQVVSLYSIHGPKSTALIGLAPKSWRFSASNCGRKWTLLDEAFGVSFKTPGQIRSFKLKNTKAYHFYRLVVDDVQVGAKALGFSVSGIQLSGHSDTLISLASLYQFEDKDALGMDSSTQFNDLMVFGQSKSVRIGAAPSLAFMGNGYLEMSPDPQGDSTYLALDDKLTGLNGLPSKFDSFSVSFWFRVFKSSLGSDFAPMGVLSWGDITGQAGQSIQLSSAIEKLSSSFGVPGSGLRGGSSTNTSLIEAWHHFAITFDYDSGLHAIYLNGAEIASRLVDQTRYNLQGNNFKIGLTTVYGPLKDQFNGLLDDIAVFKGALSPAQVKEAQYGDFTAFLPLTCQQISDRFGVSTTETWGSADDRVKKEYLRARCSTTPSTCQIYSDVFGISPATQGTADLYVADNYAAMNCDTWPSFQVREKSNAGCQGRQVIKYNVLNYEDARRRCLKQHEPPCKAYVWSTVPRDHELPNGKVVRVPANTLAMCDRKLAGYSVVENSEVAHRLRSYLIQKDTSSHCDEETGTVVFGITNNMDARALCDKAKKPRCRGYVWTGPIGLGRNTSNTPTPNAVMLCAGFREHHPTDLPGSKYETASSVGEYMVYPKRSGKCSKVAEIATLYDVKSSLEARLHCDLYDGVNRPKCLSYIWDISNGEVRLCSSVPQRNLKVKAKYETAWQRPLSCGEISNRWGVRFNQTWGVATPAVRRLYMELGCKSSPTPCQQLSDFYGLSTKIDRDLAARIPGSIRDLWLNQKCGTSPVGVGIDRQKASYQKIENVIETVSANVAEVDAILERAAASKSSGHKKDLQKDVTSARTALEQSLKKITTPVVEE